MLLRTAKRTLRERFSHADDLYQSCARSAHPRPHLAAQKGERRMSGVKLPVSVTIITLNEEKRLGAALDSVSDWVDEMIVIDSGSTDSTISIAKEKGARLLHHDWCGYGLQKRFAEEQARHDWILNIDADERITPQLRAEIEALFAEGVKSVEQKADGFFIAIHPRIYGTDRLSRKTPHVAVRLYRKSRGRYRDSPVHDRVVMASDARTGDLAGKIAHDSILSYTHAVEKMNRYSDAQVADMMAKNRRFSGVRLVGEFWLSFLKGFVLRGHWREGLPGYIAAVNYAYSRFLRQAKFYERVRSSKTD